jgi:hypothetical protein
MPRSTAHRVTEVQLSKRDGHQKGPADHAEGQHGDKTHSRFLEQLHEPRETSAKEEAAGDRGEWSPDADPDSGRHRLVEERQQHDEAERNSEKNRLAREAERHELTDQDHHLNGDI